MLYPSVAGNQLAGTFMFVDDPKNRKLKFIFLILGIVTAAVWAGLTVIRDAAEALLEYLIPH